MKQKLIILLSLLVFANFCYAQTRQLTGTISDTDSGEKLIGATISIKGSNTGVSSDVNGRYTISVKGNGDILVFKYVGYKTVEAPVLNQTVLNISLKQVTSSLDEIVVVGYGTATRGDLTTAVSTLNASQIKDVPINSAEQALTGRLAGVQVTASEGSPDAEMKIVVRGGTSVNQDNSPLYIIDGVQVENGLASISPQDIETISVLKDASATAIYGARGSNGVVLVTTKSGKTGKPKISYNGFFGQARLANKLDVLSPYEYVVYQYERSRDNLDEKTSFDNTYGTSFADLARFQSVQPIDWQERVLGNDAGLQTHNVSLTGGTNAVKYNASYAFNQQDGTVINTSYKRHLFNLKTDFKSGKKFRASLSTRYAHVEPRGLGTSDAGNATYNRLRAVVKYKPLNTSEVAEDEFDEEYFEETSSGGLGIVNPFTADNSEYRISKNNLFNISGNVDYKFNKRLSLKVSGGASSNDINGYHFFDTLSSTARNQGGRKIMARTTTRDNRTFNQSNVLTYAVRSKKNDFSILAGQEVFISRTEGNDILARDIPSGTSRDVAFDNISSYTPARTPEITYLKSTLLSFFSRANYTYDKKYLASVTLRADGSSKFAPDNRWGYFPSASFAWRVSNEKFLQDYSSTISDLKLRVSYGLTGNNRIGDYKYLNTYKTTLIYPLMDDIGNVGYEADYLANKDLTWETTTSTNLGLDLGLFKNRLQLTADLYHNKTNDVLIAAPIPTTSGYVQQLQNVASTLNKGVEFQLSAVIVQTRKFGWNSSFNISFNRNEVLKISNNLDSYLQSSGWALGSPADYIVQVGKPVGSMFGYAVDGFYKVEDFDYDATSRALTLKSGVVNNTVVTPQPGSIKFRDVTGDNMITDEDKYIIGNANPKFYGGFNQQFNLGNFDASVFVNFQVGNDVFNANKLEFTNGYAKSTNLLYEMTDRWRIADANGNQLQTYNTTSKVASITEGYTPQQLSELNQDAEIWLPLASSSGYQPTSYGVEDGSFLRINNVTLGYTFNRLTLFKKAGISRLRLYATANNLALFTNYSGFDPEVNTRRSTPVTGGVDYSAYPRSRSYYFGINLTL